MRGRLLRLRGRHGFRSGSVSHGRQSRLSSGSIEQVGFVRNASEAVEDAENRERRHNDKDPHRRVLARCPAFGLHTNRSLLRCFHISLSFLTCDLTRRIFASSAAVDRCGRTHEKLRVKRRFRNRAHYFRQSVSSDLRLAGKGGLTIWASSERNHRPIYRP